METKTDEAPTAPRERMVRLPESLLERADAMIRMLEDTPWGSAIRWNETAVVRLALARGLDLLEADFHPGIRGRKAALQRATGRRRPSE